MRNIVSVLCALAFTTIAASAAHATTGEIQSIPKAHSARVGRKVGTKSEEGAAIPAAPAKPEKMATKGLKNGSAKKPALRKGRQAKIAKPRAKRVARPRDSSGRFMKRASAKPLHPKRKVAVRHAKLGRKVTLKGLVKGRKAQHHAKITRR